MENKYQTALENVKTAPSFMGGNARYKSVLESSIPFLEDIAVLQELVDKETSTESISNDELEDVITEAMKKGNINGIIAATYFVKNMYKIHPNITVSELIKGLEELEDQLSFDYIHGGISDAKQ